MCGRYAVTTPPAGLAEAFDAEWSGAEFGPRWNLAPGQEAPVVRRNPRTKARELAPIRWGLIPHWAKDAAIGAKMINARAESLGEKPAFAEAFLKRRCLVPADAFYEWRGARAPKQPYAITLAAAGVIAFAGLWENWRTPDGGWLRSFTIVTTAANEDLAPIHDRMPVILDPADYALWLGDEPADPARLQALLKPAPSGLLRVFPVGPLVSDARREGPELLVPQVPSTIV